jgi:nitroreductase
MSDYLSKIKRKLLRKKPTTKGIFDNYHNKYQKYAFVDCKCQSEKQFEASIMRLYHTIEKGLAYKEYRAGFGKDNIDKLVLSMEQYSEKYDIETYFYKTSLSVLQAYIEKNKQHGYVNHALECRISALPGTPNDNGGVINVEKPEFEAVKTMNFEEFVSARHSIRHFALEPVDIGKIIKALEIAQHTASACNRQGWNAYIVTEKEKVSKVLANQNGNKGFGQEIDKLLVLTFDLQYSNSNREAFQGFIDGGMYATNVLNALFYEGIGSIPLSASLSLEQEKNIRPILGMTNSEVFILFIGLGNYPEETLTTRSERHAARYTIV